MADAKLTALTAASALAGADLFYVSQSAASRKATGTQLLALVGTTYVPLAGGTMTGRILLDSTASTGGIAGADSPSGAALIIRGGTIEFFNSGGSRTGLFASTGFRNNSDGEYGWSSSTDAAVASDLKIVRDAASTLAQRNGTTQQIFRLYNTYTDSSNYERLTLTGVAGTSVNITAETLGTGADNLDIVLTPAGTGRVVIGNVGIYPTSGLIQAAQLDSAIYGSSLQLKAYTNEDVIFYEGANVIGRFIGGGGLQLTERTAPSAPATNGVRIYAEDNGSGKTRLMALFATGAAQQISIEP